MSNVIANNKNINVNNENKMSTSSNIDVNKAIKQVYKQQQNK